MALYSYFILAGEASGDLHGSRLIQALKASQPLLSLCGVGGPRMRGEDFDCLLAMENFQVMGLTDVLKSLPRLWKLFYQVRDLILKMKPDVVILIDYPGFNLRLARSLRKQGYQGKIVQYICPTVWAHGKERIKTLTSHYDLLLTIYPFEAPYFFHTNLKVKYIGNPLIETVNTHHYQQDWKNLIGLPNDREYISLFPGSRVGEIHHHVPQQLQAAALLKKQHPQFLFALSCAQESLKEPLMELARKGPLRIDEDLFIVPSSFHYELMQGSAAALAKSGTVTLELALHSIPSVVHYEVSNLNYFFAKYFLKLNLPHYCIVNILANNFLYPEWVGQQISPSDLHNSLEKILFDASIREEVIAGCAAIKSMLGTASSHQLAAKAIEELMPC